MPKGASGLELIDKDQDFKPGNIRWVTKFTRKRIGKKPLREGRKLFTDRRNLNVCLEQEQFDGLVKVAERWVVSDDHPEGCSISSLVRDIIKTFLNAVGKNG